MFSNSTVVFSLEKIIISSDKDAVRSLQSLQDQAVFDWSSSQV